MKDFISADERVTDYKEVARFWMNMCCFMAILFCVFTAVITIIV